MSLPVAILNVNVRFMDEKVYTRRRLLSSDYTPMVDWLRSACLITLNNTQALLYIHFVGFTSTSSSVRSI